MPSLRRVPQSLKDKLAFTKRNLSSKNVKRLFRFLLLLKLDWDFASFEEAHVFLVLVSIQGCVNRRRNIGLRNLIQLSVPVFSRTLIA